MLVFEYWDTRVQRTKNALHQALFKLIEVQEYSEITIIDLTRVAGYSRGTFYAHYKHKDDLLDEIINLLFNKMITAYRSTYFDKKSINAQSFINEPYNLLKHFMEYGKYYQLLLGNNFKIDFRDKLTNKIINLTVEDFEIESNEIDEEKVDDNLLMQYSAYGLAGLILDWVKEDFPISPEEFSKELAKTIQYTLGTIKIKLPAKYSAK